VIVKLAIRTLRRNRWRTALTLGGIAVATALLVWMVCLVDGMIGQMVRAATGVELGQIQLHDAEYALSPSVYDAIDDVDEVIARLEQVPGVERVSARVRLFGLLGDENRSQVARVVGVDPEPEAAASLLDDALIAGAWLSSEPTDHADWDAELQVVIGDILARQLRVEVGSSLALFATAADGSMLDRGVRVVGIVHTGNPQADRMSVYLHLEDAQYLGALEGRAHEVSIGIDDYEVAPLIASAAIDGIEAGGRRVVPWYDREQPYRAFLAGDIDLQQFLTITVEGDLDREGAVVVRPWQQLLPAISTMIELNNTSTWFMFFVVYLIVALGIVNTQRMSALERRREFGVLMAIGLNPRQLARMIMVETVVLTLLGALIGIAMGMGLGAYHAAHGLSLTSLSSGDSGDFSLMGVSFTDRLYAQLSFDAAWMPLSAIFVVAVLCGIWPAIRSARLQITQAISGRS